MLLLSRGCSLPREGRDQAPGWGPLGGRSAQEAGGELPACAKHAVEPPCLLLTVKTPLWVPPSAPGAPRLSLGHLVVVAMETTSKMACKSTQAITRGRAAEQWGRAGTLHLPPHQSPVEERAGEGAGTGQGGSNLDSVGEGGHSGGKGPVSGGRQVNANRLVTPTQPPALTGAEEGQRACTWGAGSWGSLPWSGDWEPLMGSLS